MSIKVRYQYHTLTSMQVVRQNSACIDGAERVGLEVNHNMLQRHPSPDSDSFVRIADRLKTFAENAYETLAKKKCKFFQEDAPKKFKITSFNFPSGVSTEIHHHAGPKNHGLAGVYRLFV
jgi:hypothetical protein